MAFAGKVALVTGAASGMGRLATRRLADTGAAVAAFDVNEEGLAETAEGRESVRPQVVDVTDAAAVAAAVEQTESELGPIERVLNAAAIMPTGYLMEQDLDVIHRIMDINYGGVVNIATATLRKMLERGRGELVNFASLAGWIPLEHFGAYNASKFAVVAFTEVLAHENRDRGVRFACVCPPPVATPLLDQAESKPKILDQAPPIKPEAVLDAIDRALEAGRFWVFPGRGSSAAWRARRWIPNLVWKNLDRIEQR